MPKQERERENSDRNVVGKIRHQIFYDGSFEFIAKVVPSLLSSRDAALFVGISIPRDSIHHRAPCRKELRALRMLKIQV